MATLITIAKRIQKARRANIPDYKIGREMGICAAEIKRLANGKYPGPKVAARLGLREICPSCHRVHHKSSKAEPAAWVREAVNNLIMLRERIETC